MIKKILLTVALVFSALGLNAEVVYPSSSLAVAYVSSFESFENAYTNLREYAANTPSVRTFLDPVWDEFSSLDIRAMLLKELEVTPDELNELFSGSLTIAVGSDMEMLETEDMLPASFTFSAQDEESAQQLLEKMLAEESEHASDEQVSGEYSYYTIEMPMPEDEATEDGQMVTIYLSRVLDRVVLATNQGFLEENIDALKQQGTASASFWSKVGEDDCALWIAPKPIWGYIRGKIAQANEDPEMGMGPMITVEMYDMLALDDFYSMGMVLSLDPLEVSTEIAYNPDTQGLLKFLSCEGVGIEPIGIIPDDSIGFNAARTDLACFWDRVKEIAGKLVPPSMAMYHGWNMEVQSQMGVNVDQQFFGAFGDKEFFYEQEDDQGEVTSVFLVSLKDPKGFEQGLEAMWSYFAQGESYFDKESIGDVPVWRMKSQYQTSEVPPVSYAISSEWLIVTMGDPVVITDLLDRLKKSTPSKVWENPLVAEQMQGNPNLNGILYRPLSYVLQQMATGIVTYDLKRVASEMDKAEMEEGNTDNVREPLWDVQNLPDFDDVEGAVVTAYSVDRGLVSGHLKITTQN